MEYSRTCQRYGNCETYFVETDDGVYAARAEERERHRAMGRLRQRALGQELSRLTEAEYLDDVLDHMDFMEGETLPDVSSIDIQTEIQWYMRPYLLDFLIEAHTAFQLLPDTLFLAVNLLDRYCSRRVVYKRHYQLVGCAALLVAAKYGDKKDRVPQIRELKSMCCGLYEDDMFIQMERHVLSTLDWTIGHPTVDSFLQIALSESYDPEVEHMSWYICEHALFIREYVSVRPSVLARSALALSRLILARQPLRPDTWSGSYDLSLLYSLTTSLFSPSSVLYRKYASMHLSGVSVMVEGYLERETALAKQRDTAMMMDMEEPSEPVKEQQQMPSTPQKPQVNSVMINGCLTPPITPEGERFAGQGYAANNAAINVPAAVAVYPKLPPTPSPLSTTQHVGQHAFTYSSFPPPPQPQSVPFAQTAC